MIVPCSLLGGVPVISVDGDYWRLTSTCCSGVFKEDKYIVEGGVCDDFSDFLFFYSDYTFCKNITLSSRMLV